MSHSALNVLAVLVASVWLTGCAASEGKCYRHSDCDPVKERCLKVSPHGGWETQLPWSDGVCYPHCETEADCDPDSYCKELKELELNACMYKPTTDPSASRAQGDSEDGDFRRQVAPADHTP